MQKSRVKQNTGKEELINVILNFYLEHPGYKMSQNEFVGVICAISQQMLSDI